MPNGFRSAWLHKLCSAARRFALIGTGNEPGWSPAPAISRHILRRNPDIGRRRRRLPEHVDRNPPARIPIAADAEPMRPHLRDQRSEQHTSELQSLMRLSYAVFCFNKKTFFSFSFFF